MASFSAELRVAGHAFPVILCSYSLHQATHQRGRVSTKVRHGPVQLTLSVPDNDVLLAWAVDPQKRQAATVVFFDANSGSAMETLLLPAAYAVAYAEQFHHGDDAHGAYVCFLTLSDPDGWTIQAGGPGSAFVAPAPRNHGVPSASELSAAIGAGPAVLDPHAADWAAARAQVLDPVRIAALYASYAAGKRQKKELPRSQADWWGKPGKRGGAGKTVEGCLGEYQADKLFAAQGHSKLNHDGNLVGLLDPPRGRGLDGVWRNATPPPEYWVTETKFTSSPDKEPSLTKGQMSDRWVLDGDRLQAAVGPTEARLIARAMRRGQVGKLLLHVDPAGHLHEFAVDARGNSYSINLS
jgi:hypothetical protein